MKRSRLLLSVTAAFLTACSDRPREATQHDAEAVTEACNVRLAHFGHHYRFDGDELPDNAIWLDAMMQSSFDKAKACIELHLSKRNARALVVHR
jgi:hypothetical protein